MFVHSRMREFSRNAKHFRVVSEFLRGFNESEISKADLIVDFCEIMTPCHFLRFFQITCTRPSADMLD